jgi:hypothetical protein
MARKNFDSTDYLQHMNYAWPTAGESAVFVNATTTLAVALATIATTDIVIVTNRTIGATAGYIASYTITPGTGFTLTASADVGGGCTVAYVVFRKNS